VRCAPRSTGGPGHDNVSCPHLLVGHPPSCPPGHPLPLPIVHACRGPATRTSRQHGSTPRSTSLPSKLCVPRPPYKGPPLLTVGAPPWFSGRRRRTPPPSPLSCLPSSPPLPCYRTRATQRPSAQPAPLPLPEQSLQRRPPPGTASTPASSSSPPTKPTNRSLVSP
jgi:hypothetical protein